MSGGSPRKLRSATLRLRWQASAGVYPAGWKEENFLLRTLIIIWISCAEQRNTTISRWITSACSTRRMPPTS